MDLNETTVLKEITQVLNGEYLSARKNSSNNSAFSPDNLKENNNNNKFNGNLDKTYEQENFNFTDFEDKAVDNSNNVNVCEVSINESTIVEEVKSEDKYLVRNPVNDTTIAGYSSDEETFAECHSYIIPEPKPCNELASTTASTQLNETVNVGKSSKLSLNLNFESLKIDDHDDLDKTTTEIVDDVKSEDEEEVEQVANSEVEEVTFIESEGTNKLEGEIESNTEEEEEEQYKIDEHDFNETFKTMPEQNIKPIEFEEFGLPRGHSNQSVNENFEFATDESFKNETQEISSPHVPCESNIEKNVQERESEVFHENLQNSLEVEFKVPEVPATNKLVINQKWYPPNPPFDSMENMVPGNEFNFDAGAFDIFNKTTDLDHVPVREDSLLLRFDPLLNRPVPVVLDVPKETPIAEEEEEDEQIVKNRKSLNRLAESGNLLDITIQGDQSVEIIEENNEEQETNSLNNTITDEETVNKTLNDTLDQLRVRSPQSYDSQDISDSDIYVVPPSDEIFDKRSANCIRRSEHCTTEDLDSGNETMSVHTINDIKTVKEDDPVIETTNSQQNNKEDYKMAEIEKKLKNKGIKSEDNDRKLKEFESREEALIKRISEKEKVIAKMNSVIEAYETTISEFISEKAQITQRYEKKCTNLQQSSQLNASHLLSLEDTFSDLHTKYERSKQMAINFKQNEDKLIAEKNQLNELLATQEARYEKMKSHAMSQLQVANDKLENLSVSHFHEVSKLKALLKKEEIARTALAEQLQQKIRENEELVKICEELIGGGNVASENS